MNITYRIKEYHQKRKWRKQRAKKGYCEKDIWDMNVWFLEIVPKMLNELADTTSWSPKNFTIDEWKEYLRSMATTLDTVKIYSSYDKNADDELKSFIDMFFEHFYDLWS